MPTDSEWTKLNRDKANEIKKSMCLNYAFQNIGRGIKDDEIKLRIKDAKNIYAELIKEDVERW